MNKAISILLVEGSDTYVPQIRAALESEPNPLKLTRARNITEARACLSESCPDLALIDSVLPDGLGIELLPTDRGDGVYPAVIMADRGDIPSAVVAMQVGALDYLVKSDTTQTDLTRAIKRALRESAKIKEQRRAEAELQESEERLRSFFESAASGMAILSPEGRPLKVNPTFCRLSGYSEAEILGKNVLEVTHPADREMTLRHSEKRFRTIFNNAAAGMVTLSPEGQFLEVNEAFCRFLGYPREKLLNLRVPEITHPDDLEKTAKNYQLLGSDLSRTIDYQKRYLRRDGSIVWGQVSMASVAGDNGLPLYYIGLVQDITESKHTQDEVRESKQMLQLVLDYIPQHVFWKDRNSVYLGCNRNFARAAGVETPQDLVGLSDHDLVWKREEADFYRECDRRVMAADRPELHIIEQQLQASGKQAWLDTNKIPLHDGDDQVVGMLGTFEDITERKQAEKKLVEANRELDAFVYTVSHDLRTPLTPIIGYAEILQNTCRDRLDAQSLGCLAEIENQGRGMLALLEDLLILAKVGHLPRPTETVDLNLLVEEILTDMGSQLAQAGIIVEKHHLPGLRIPKTLLTQIFTNLFDNALRYAGLENSSIEVGGERQRGLVSLYVRDHGPGIRQDERGQIFEVFYRGATDEKIPGTGVGLATVQKIARLYGGQAWVEETPGGGSTFRVELADTQGANNSKNHLTEPLADLSRVS